MEEDLNNIKQNLNYSIIDNKFLLYYSSITGNSTIQEEGAKLIADKIKNSKIEEVTISHCFTDDGFDIFLEALRNNISNIKVVNLYNNPLRTEDLSRKFGQFLATMPNLSSLKFDCSVNDICFPIICEAIQFHPSLKSLEIREGLHVMYTPSTFKSIELLQGLENLTLEGCITESVAEVLFDQGNKISISSICIIDRGKLTPKGAKIIGANLGPKVKSFTFDLFQYVEDAKEEKVIAILDELLTNNNLETLGLGGNIISFKFELAKAKLAEFLQINRSVKTLLLNKNDDFMLDATLTNALKNSNSLEMLSIDSIPVDNLMVWHVITGSNLRKVVFGDVLIKGKFPQIAEAIKDTPTLEEIEIKNLKSVERNKDLISLYITQPLEKNKANIAKWQDMAIQMQTKSKFLVTPNSFVDLSKIDLSKADNFSNIASLNALKNANQFILNRALGENTWLVNAFLNVYKNNNGLLLTSVHKSKTEFEAQDGKGVSNLVFLPQEIWAKIFSYISVEEMYSIAKSKNTTSKIEEVTDDVLVSGTDTHDVGTDF